MTDNVSNMLSVLKERAYRKRRSEGGINLGNAPLGVSAAALEAERFEAMLDAEKVNIFDGDIFGFNRTQIKRPFHIMANGEESGQCNCANFTPEYSIAIDRGFDDILREIEERKKTAETEAENLYLAMERFISAIYSLCDRYRAEAERTGNKKLADALLNVPRKRPSSFYEACLFHKILVFSLRAAGASHVGLGRFDMYMYPYYKMDIDGGATKQELLEITELFFISLNFDTDIYPGMQQGDNGQSMVLGGFDRDGNYVFNGVSELCMDASLELNVIDPKINLRVGKNTPTELYEYGTKLTKKGLGFPQYCNDDIVIPGLVALGYDYEDALNYTVAACWEFIIPGCGCDVPNYRTMNFPLVVGNAIREGLAANDESYEVLEKRALSALREECERIIDSALPLEGDSAVMISILTKGCIESGKDFLHGGAKYYSTGCHGAGIAVAADSLSAVKKLVYDEQKIKPEELLKVLEANFEGYAQIRNELRACPKMGNNDDYADDIASKLMETFSDSLNGKKNTWGGVWRAGTGSAMEYILSAKKCPATPDGRGDFEPYGCSFSPAITTKLDGPLSVIQSFTKFDLKKIINGGPLTMELHDNIFRNEEGERKVAQLVKLFIDRGGHQLQLNSINRDNLIDAQNHPEEHQNLIVRVWGWSGYFCELEKVYQDHIIKRMEFNI